ncbi:26S proteasome regulatory subunit rpn11 [Elsinoe australis]|uniref:26S proteasome regulatory subunit rpn11 n=1 Tax=Elsinoe australis TaxID=40998 RepID=A0A2P8A1I3_9PEZI|nr:26S proteasome regulatory subunit rpn11 [Elsinoe australis]
MPQPAIIGLVPTKSVDVPVDAVFIALFIALAASHMTLFRRNLSRGHKFLFNAMLFGFSMSRIVANVMRLAWAFRPHNVDIQLVATIFLNAGILLVYIINNLLTWRLIRSRIPSFGWNRIPRTIYKAQLWLVLPTIIMVIVIIVVSIKAPTPYRSLVMTEISRFAQTYFLVLAVQPLILIPVALLWPTQEPRDDFGEGSFNTKAVILLVSTTLASIEAVFRASTTWEPARPATNPAWYHSKPAFYCFNFGIDILILTFLLFMRIDKRFWVPNKANGPGSYSQPVKETKAGESSDLE